MKKHILISLITATLVSSIAIIFFLTRNSGSVNTQVDSNKNTESTAVDVNQNQTGLPLVIPEEFQIYTYAKSLSGPRDLLWVEDTLLVSTPAKGQVVALLDTHNNGWSDKTTVVISGLNKPHGLAYKDGTLYVAETDGVSKYEYDKDNKKAKLIKELIKLPGGGNHWSRSLLIVGDELYTSVGSTCNVCNENDLKRASVIVSDLDGNNQKTYASGLRNAPFLTQHPKTKQVWVTEMGRDHLGDDFPPDEINILESGRDYGWPYCYGKNIHDKTFDSAKYSAPDICSFLNKTPSLIDLPAHSAPLGLIFTPDSWPKPYSNVLLIALHGSWNRSKPTGYKIVYSGFDLTGNPISQKDFISGWLEESGKKLGRPVDLEFNPAGDLFISDDQSGNVYLVKLKSVVK